MRREGTHRLTLSGETHLRVYADEQKIEQVLVNLATNAVKYAPSSPDVRIFVQQQDGVARISEG
ncbi:MAG: hypothetical protein JST19_13910 [Bacteroidetes bacterium]|nr:hypothetical protein [Bacteroidota bacterium]